MAAGGRAHRADRARARRRPARAGDRGELRRGGSLVLVVGHLLSTSTFDLLAWAVVTWLVARVVRTGDERLWPSPALVPGVALLNKPLIAFLPSGARRGVVISGPRRLLRGRWLGRRGDRGAAVARRG